VTPYVEDVFIEGAGMPRSHPPESANHAAGAPKFGPWRDNPLKPPELVGTDKRDGELNQRNARARSELRRRGSSQTGVGG
jgi:hypothetical protein